MKLFNTASRRIEEVKPQKPPAITVYTCGPTVYDYAHVGHWFTYVRADILIRALKAAGFKPQWVMNITDVGHLVSDADHGEDKLEKSARREGKTAWEIADYYTKDFVLGMQELNITKPAKMPKATEHIADQIKLIQKLESKGFTYVIDDGVYYDTAKFPRYAEFARLDLDEQQAGARVSSNPQKHNPSDFAVWKFSPAGQQRDMEWDSPWGTGFPGWHIECSAMSMKYLSETLDMHTGGIDHIPVHHTNEIAQSEAATGQQFVRHWMHSDHIMIEGEKISKSLVNGISLQEVISEGFPPEALRLYVLESHYRGQSKFNWDGLQAANNRLDDLRAMAALRWQPRGVTHDMPTFALEEVATTLTDFLANDLDTPQALAFLSQITTQLLTVHIEEDMVDHLGAMLKGIDDLLGLNLSAVQDISPAQKELLRQRETARANQDWKLSDEIRDRLKTEGIGLNDAARGVIWYPLWLSYKPSNQ
ncbi:cysteine--tRNA ligase [Candidatus Saccharibacteria bacterium CG_4_10_14_0_2_um_filter_52_9]|nr:MAG: cysteine--tRNA ligase [Candidatus Saccharibacteria bacterium CG_4_10_14_0_2_um_filter_52_9]